MVPILHARPARERCVQCTNAAEPKRLVRRCLFIMTNANTPPHKQGFIARNFAETRKTLRSLGGLRRIDLVFAYIGIALASLYTCLVRGACAVRRFKRRRVRLLPQASAAPAKSATVTNSGEPPTA